CLRRSKGPGAEAKKPTLKCLADMRPGGKKPPLVACALGMESLISQLTPGFKADVGFPRSDQHQLRTAERSPVSGSSRWFCSCAPFGRGFEGLLCGEPLARIDAIFQRLA